MNRLFPIVLWTGLAFVLLLACSGTPAPAAPSPSPATSQGELAVDVLAIYHKSGGIAGIDETLTVHQGGLLELETRNASPKSLQVNEQILLPLRNTLEQPDFGTLQSVYQAAGADLITYTITARDSSGQTKTVTTTDSAKQPDYLGLLIVMFEQLHDIVAKNG